VDCRGQDSQKSHNVVIGYFAYFGRSPTVPIDTKICIVGNLADIITYAKFRDDIFKGYDFSWVEFTIFMGFTTVQ